MFTWWWAEICINVIGFSIVQFLQQQNCSSLPIFWIQCFIHFLILKTFFVYRSIWIRWNRKLIWVCECCQSYWTHSAGVKEGQIHILLEASNVWSTSNPRAAHYTCVSICSDAFSSTYVSVCVILIFRFVVSCLQVLNLQQLWCAFMIMIFKNIN